MTRLITLSFFAVTFLATPLHAQLWDEEPPSETVDPKDAGDTPENGSDDEAELEEEKPQPDPLIIKSNKVFKRVRRLDLSGAFDHCTSDTCDTITERNT